MNNFDVDTGFKHIPPAGMFHHKRRLKGKGSWYAAVNMRHFVISLHQEAFPDLKKRMEDDPNNATNIYTYFLATLPLIVKGKITPEIKDKIMKVYKLLW